MADPLIRRNQISLEALQRDHETARRTAQIRGGVGTTHRWGPTGPTIDVVPDIATNGGGGVDESYYRSAAGVCNNLQTNPLSSSYWFLTARAPARSSSDTTTPATWLAAMQRWGNRSGLYPSGWTTPVSPTAVRVSGFKAGYLYASPFIDPHARTLEELIIFTYDWPRLRSSGAVDFYQTYKLRLGVYTTQSETDLRPAGLLAQTDELDHDQFLSTTGAYPIGGTLKSPTGGTLSGGLRLAANRLYWFALLYRYVNTLTAEFGGPEYYTSNAMLHADGSGGYELTEGGQNNTVIGTGRLEIPDDPPHDLYPTVAHPIFGYYYGSRYVRQQKQPDNNPAASGFDLTPTRNGLRAFAGSSSLSLGSTWDGATMPHAWPEQGTVVNVLTESVYLPYANILNQQCFPTPYIYGRFNGQQDCVTVDYSVCLTADSLCLTLPFSYAHSGGPTTGTLHVLMTRVTTAYPAVFQGTAVFAAGTANELAIDLVLIVSQPGPDGIPELFLQAAVALINGAPPANGSAVLLPVWARAGLGMDVTACNPLALALRPKNVDDFPPALTLTCDAGARVVTITGGTGTQDTSSCGAGGGTCPASQTLCVYLPITFSGGVATFGAFGVLTYVEGTAAPRVWRGAVFGGTADSGVYVGGVSIEVTDVGPPPDVVLKVAGNMVVYIPGTYPMVGTASLTTGTLHVVSCGPPFDLQIRPAGPGAWTNYALGSVANAAIPPATGGVVVVGDIVLPTGNHPVVSETITSCRAGPVIPPDIQPNIDALGNVPDETVVSAYYTPDGVASSITGPGVHVVRATEALIHVDTTAGDVTVVMPSAATLAGSRRTVIKVDASGNDVHIIPQGGEWIDGQDIATLTTQWQTAGVESDGANLTVAVGTPTLSGFAHLVRVDDTPIGTVDGDYLRAI